MEETLFQNTFDRAHVQQSVQQIKSFLSRGRRLKSKDRCPSLGLSEVPRSSPMEKVLNCGPAVKILYDCLQQARPEALQQQRKARGVVKDGRATKETLRRQVEALCAARGETAPQFGHRDRKEEVRRSLMGLLHGSSSASRLGGSCKAARHVRMLTKGAKEVMCGKDRADAKMCLMAAGAYLGIPEHLWLPPRVRGA